VRPFFALLILIFSHSAIALTESDFVGSWKLVNQKWISEENPDEEIIYPKTINIPEELKILEVKPNGIVNMKQFDAITGKDFSEIFGRLHIQNKQTSDEKSSILLEQKDILDIQKFFPKFDGYAPIVLAQDHLTLTLTQHTYTYQRITNSESEELIAKKIELNELAKQRANRLYSLVYGKTFEYLETEDITFDNEGKKIEEQSKISQGEMNDHFWRQDEHMNSMNSTKDKKQPDQSDDQIEEGSIQSLIAIRTIKFDRVNEEGNLDITINKSLKAVMVPQLKSSKNFLYVLIFFKSYKEGKIDRNRIAIPNESLLILRGNKLEFRTSYRNEPELKEGLDKTHRFTVISPRQAPRPAPAADVK